MKIQKNQLRISSVLVTKKGKKIELILLLLAILILLSLLAFALSILANHKSNQVQKRINKLTSSQDTQQQDGSLDTSSDQDIYDTTATDGTDGQLGASGVAGRAGPPGPPGPPGAAGSAGSFSSAGYHTHTMCVKSGGQFASFKNAHGGAKSCGPNETEVEMVFKNH